MRSRSSVEENVLMKIKEESGGEVPSPFYSKKEKDSLPDNSVENDYPPNAQQSTSPRMSPPIGVVDSRQSLAAFSPGRDQRGLLIVPGAEG